MTASNGHVEKKSLGKHNLRALSVFLRLITSGEGFLQVIVIFVTYERTFVPLYLNGRPTI